jgi:hypothetical protein
MRIASILGPAALVLLAGCSVVPATAWNFDPTRPPAKRVATMQEVVPLTEQVAALQIRRNDVRARIASEPDVWRRQGLYAELHSVGSDLAQLERELATIASSR